MKGKNGSSIIALWIIIGVAVGAAIGSANERIDLWLGLGAVAGATVGYLISKGIDRLE